MKKENLVVNQIYKVRRNLKDEGNHITVVWKKARLIGAYRFHAVFDFGKYRESLTRQEIEKDVMEV